MTQEKLLEKLENGINEFYNETINLHLSLSKIIENFSYIKFINCHFIESIHLEARNKDAIVIFHDCIFNKKVDVLRCDLNKIQFSFLSKKTTLNIKFCSFKDIIINSNDLPVEGNIKIENCAVLDQINCSNLNLIKGQFTFSTRFKKEEVINFNSLFLNSIFETANFTSVIFGKEADFTNFKIIETCFFTNCHFKKIYFKDSDFGNNTMFHDCKFYSYKGFENCKNIQNTHFKISSCLFKSFPHLNNSEFNHLEIIHTTFERKTSFDLVKTNTIKLYQVTFEENAYFDDFEIKNIDYCDRKSIRIIKQEIQKAENRIDYNRFKSYEMSTYYKELSWKENFIDKSILYMRKISTNYGNSWTKALIFTLLFALFFFSIFFISENYNNSFDLKNWQNFAKGYIRFFLITDFYNPLAKGRTYIESFWSWIPFILGKIFIAFGIYEMIQSFRKFKA